MTEHLNRSFFEEELSKLAEAFGKEEGGGKVYVDLLLRDGVTLRMEGSATCTENHLMFDHKPSGLKSRMVIPYVSILGIRFSCKEERTGIKGFRSE